MAQKNEDTLSLVQENPVHLIPFNPLDNLWTIFCSQFNKLTHTQKYFCLQQELTDFEGIEGYLHENHVNSLQELRAINGLDIDNSLTILPSNDSLVVDLAGSLEELHLSAEEIIK